MREAEYFGRCRNLAAANALEAINEAIGSDRRAAGRKVERHLQIARDALLDSLSIVAEDES
jgi:hypothetical protein